jgi:zinc and cadmium transporter
MRLLSIAIALSVMGSFGSLLVASVLLVLREPLRRGVVPWLVSYAVGTLLGVALLDVLPEAASEMPPNRMFGTLLAGIIFFFVLEKVVRWHCHADECEVHTRPASLVLIGHGFHSFVDGAVIGAAVHMDVRIALTAAIAIAAHEIPQQVGDFAILLHAGYNRGRAMSLSILSAAGAIAGTLAAFFTFVHTPHLLPYALAFAAASFIYIALADLVPGLHHGRVDASSVRQLVLVCAGIVTAMLL